MDEIVIIKDEGKYYNHLTKDITEKVVDKNVIIATKMSEEEFLKKFGIDVDHYQYQSDSRHLIRTDKGLLFFDEKTGTKILLNEYAELL